MFSIQIIPIPKFCKEKQGCVFCDYCVTSGLWHCKFNRFFWTEGAIYAIDKHETGTVDSVPWWRFLRERITYWEAKNNVFDSKGATSNVTEVPGNGIVNFSILVGIAKQSYNCQIRKFNIWLLCLRGDLCQFTLSLCGRNIGCRRFDCSVGAGGYRLGLSRYRFGLPLCFHSLLPQRINLIPNSSQLLMSRVGLPLGLGGQLGEVADRRLYVRSIGGVAIGEKGDNQRANRDKERQPLIDGEATKKLRGG
jgi:hypothetical protein